MDRNRHKNVCFNKAVSQGLSTARLPIDGYLQLKSSFSTVITVNQVRKMYFQVLSLLPGYLTEVKIDANFDMPGVFHSCQLLGPQGLARGSGYCNATAKANG